MIKLVENNKEAEMVLEYLSIDTAPLLACEMFTEGFGVKQDFLQFYAAFNDSGKLCAAFVKCNDRVFCLIETLYDKDEILWFLNGFEDFKIFISSDFADIIDRKSFNVCILMKNQGISSESSLLLSDIDSKTFTNIIMNGKDKDAKIRFLLNNSHLSRHGYLKNHAYISDGEVLSIASCYGGSKGEYLCNVFTPDVHRRKGYAGALIREITNNNKEYHLICVEDVSVLYEKCGFKPYAKWIEFLY